MAHLRGRRGAVCIVRHNYYPDSHVRRDAEALAQAGYDVTVVALRRPNQPPRELLNEVGVVRLPVEHIRGGILRYAWEYSAFAILAFFTVALLHLRKRFRVVEVDNMPDILVFSALIPRLAGARVILYIFDNMPDLFAYLRRVGPWHPIVLFLTWLERLSAAFADRVVVTQEMPRRAIVARGVPPQKITTVLNCADEAVFQAPERTDTPPKRAAFTIVSHGVILERYGIQVLIDALPRIAAEIPEVRVEIFGAGEHRTALEEQVRALGLDSRVHFRGFAPLEELLATLADADAGYVGMLNDLVLPNKLMEYVSMGVPVLLARWPTFEHYFPEDTVAYFAPGSSGDLARAVLGLHRDPAAARARAERAQTLYRRSYAWRIQRDVYLGVYADLLGDAGREAAGPLRPGRRDTVSPSRAG